MVLDVEFLITNNCYLLFQIVALLLISISLVRGHPLNGRELDSAVEGVQKYLESAGFPKMTRGEVLEFLNEFSWNSRVSRSEQSTNGKKDITKVVPQPILRQEEIKNSNSRPKIPNGESPLNYGYPISSNKDTEQLHTSTTPTIFVTLNDEKLPSNKQKEIMLQTVNGKNAPTKSIIPSVDLNAYAKFKKIPEARNMKIDNEMKDFLNNFGLLDAPKLNKSVLDAPKSEKPMLNVQKSNKSMLDSPKSGKSINFRESTRRQDNGFVTESVDDKLLKSLLVETGNSKVNVSQLQPFLENVSTRDHVFNPSSSNVKTVDINRIAKIVENIRLLTDDNNTVSLPQDAIQKKLENLTAAISAIDQPNSSFNGYEVFFDDDSKEIDSDLPDSPTISGTEPLSKAYNPPDPLSTDELQQLYEKNKSDVKRQEPINDTIMSDIISSTEESITVSMTATDLSSEATSVESISNDENARDSVTTAAADTNPSLSQLAESFGGGDTASSVPSTDEQDTTTVPGRPKSGLYFYVDWNSFLTVNGGQKNEVNLRFAPKAGNPAHFIKVNIP